MNILGYKIETNSVDLNKYLKRLNRFETYNSKKIFSIREVDSNNIDFEKLDYYGDGYYFYNNKVGYEDNRIKLLYDYYNNKIKFSYKFKNHQIVRSKMRIKGEYILNRQSYIYRYCVVYPLSLLLVKDGYLLIHCSAVENIKNKANVFIGFNGVGKSTKAFSEFVQNENVKTIISDNFVLTNGSEILPIPDLFKTDKKLDTNLSFKYVGKTYGKNAYQIQYQVKQKYRIETLEYLKRNTNKIEISNFNMFCLNRCLCKELTEHTFTSFLIDHNEYNNYIKSVSRKLDKLAHSR